ncbi:RNA polymerase I associated factor, A49-like [Dillenia turbinata]|uniref:RNA polymerase I associated factor, A49-like n=1 Tax=Dillenia turbinata TaxID=194707 RepID=A0AAN8YQX8_9MAGN
MADDDEQQTHTKSKKRKKLHLTTETIPEQPSKMAPIVGYFPSGYNPHEDQSESSHKVRVYQNKQRQHRMELVVSPKHGSSKVDFVGTSYKGEATTPQICTYALGIVDKETQTLKIVPVACNKIFRLEPRVRGMESAVKEASTMSRVEPASEVRMNKMNDLRNLYGTKKDIARAKKMETLRFKEDAEAQGDLEKQIEDVVVNKEALESADSHTDRNTPAYNISATKPEEAYPLEKIILSGEWDYLFDVYGRFKKGKSAKDSYASFVRHRFHSLSDFENEKERKTLARILSYINHLIKFRDRDSMDGYSSAKDHKLPSILIHRFAELFKDPGKDDRGRSRISNEKSDLLINYILVLTLHADGFRTDPTDIAKDLRMTTGKIRSYYQLLGCKFVRDSTALYATLPVPLKFPEMRYRRRSGRRN